MGVSPMVLLTARTGETPVSRIRTMATASKKRVIVIGGGLAGLACTIKLAEEGVNVDLFSMVPVKRSHSVCAQGGINACNDIARQQGYSEWEHFDETIYGG